MKRMKIIDLTILLKNYEEKWVALNSENTKVIASGDTLAQALN